MKDWAVILGASGGIGAECALRLAKKGINIYGVYLRKKKHHIDKLKNQLLEYNVEVIYKKANASNEKLRKKNNWIDAFTIALLKKEIEDWFNGK